MRNTRKDRKKEQPEFFKVFLPGVTDQRLGIPRAFWKHMKDESSGTVSLIGPSGNVWYVSLDKDDYGLYFQRGWQDFVRDHSLKFGYMLVFRYDDNLSFTVKIFGRSGCAEDNAFSAESCQDVTGFGEFKGKKRVRKTAPKDIDVSAANKRRSSHGALKSQRRDATEEEVNKAFEEAESFKSSKPFSIRVMRPSSVYFGFSMQFSSQFTIAHLPRVRDLLILYDPMGKAWKVNYIIKGTNCGCLSGGWGAFSYGNNLEMNDVCVFELIARNKLQVHIFRVVKEITPLIKTTKERIKEVN